MATSSAIAPTRKSMPLWLALAVGAAILVLALLADAMDVRPAPVVETHLDRPYLPTQHLSQDLAR